MDINKVLDSLGYSEQINNWSIDENVVPATAHLWRSASAAGVYGSYMFRTSPESNSVLPPKPAVHVARANDVATARLIHRRVWNLGTAPFLIVVLPNQVRVYSGFNYDANHEDAGFVDMAYSLDDVRIKLQDFTADEINSGRIWRNQVKNLNVEKRVDRRLLKNLESLGRELIENRRVAPEVAHALIGKYIYIKYLEDRRILSHQWLEGQGITLAEATGSAASLFGLHQVSDALERRFNGGIFPLPSVDEGVLPDQIIQYVAGIFRGDDPTSGQLALDFMSYDFSYIPIEMLSSIYEQFLRVEGKDRGEGAFYTREFVADYLICEIDSVKPLQLEMQILDPSCGSGVFLVLAYRRLIEAEIIASQKHTILPERLKEILEQSIFGVEKSLDACYVTEFSLILTLLSYIDPPELHENEGFRFPVLHNRNVFHCDFFDDSSLFWISKYKFDWILGNPPWIKLKSTNYQAQIHAWNWMRDEINQVSRPVGKFSTSEAFSWRVVDLLRDDGCVGLLIHSTSLFNSYSNGYRSKFFISNEIRRVTNFSNLAYVLFPGRSDAPAATLIYTKSDQNSDKQSLIHCGPFVANQLIIRSFGSTVAKRQTWVLTLYEDEIKVLEHKSIESGSAFVWKLALWGNHRDVQVLGQLTHMFSKTLQLLVLERDWNFNQGLEICHKDTQKSVYVEELKLYKRLNVDKVSGGFYLKVPEDALEVIPEEYHYVKSRGGRIGLQIAKAPHLHWTVTFAAYSDSDFVMPRPQIGIAAPIDDANRLKALSIYLNSSVGRYLLFFRCASWGIDRNTFSLADAESMPVPDFTQTQIDNLASLHNDLSTRTVTSGQLSLFDSNTIPYANEGDIRSTIDNHIEKILHIPSDLMIVVKDFMRFRYKLLKGKSTGEAVELVTRQQLELYVKRLRYELDEFAETYHRIQVDNFRGFSVCTVEVTHSKHQFEPVINADQSVVPTVLSDIWKSVGLEFSQWAYVQRGLRIFVGSKLYLFKSSRTIDWTVTQAMIDSDDIIAEVLVTR